MGGVWMSTPVWPTNRVTYRDSWCHTFISGRNRARFRGWHDVRFTVTYAGLYHGRNIRSNCGRRFPRTGVGNQQLSIHPFGWTSVSRGNLIYVAIRLTVHHHITGVTIVIAKRVPSSECTLLQQHPMSYRDRTCLCPTVPSLQKAADANKQRLLGNRLGTRNQVRLWFDIVLVPVESRVVDQVIHRQHWLLTKHEGVWRNSSDTVWCSVVNQHQVRQRLRPLPPLGLT